MSTAYAKWARGVDKALWLRQGLRLTDVDEAFTRNAWQTGMPAVTFAATANLPRKPKAPGMDLQTKLAQLSNADRVRLEELVRRYQEAQNVFTWTFVIGFFCLWPLWIITYIENLRMRDAVSQMRLMGFDPNALVG